MKLNPEKMEERGFSFESTDDLLLYVSNLLEYFRYHNKNLTKAQEQTIRWQGSFVRSAFYGRL